MKYNLHMHDIKNYLDDRYSFFHDKEPVFLKYRGVAAALDVGTAVHYALDCHYLNMTDDLRYFNVLPSKKDQVVTLGLVEAYKKKYKDEMFHNYQAPIWNIPIKKHNIICRPDLVADTYFENRRVILEFKTSSENTQETLDFQTMCYCWASYRWDFVIPQLVLKRTFMKPRIKQKQKESEQDFLERLMTYYEDKHFKSDSRTVNKTMILEFEKYLIQILKEMDSRNKYKFYKPTTEYWG